MTDSSPLNGAAIAARAALLAADTAATGAVAHLTVTIALATITYFTATLAVLQFLSQSANAVILAMLPAPILLLQIYQIVLAGANRRRTESTRTIEFQLIRAANLEQAYDAYRVGSRATESVTDPGMVKLAPGGWVPLRMAGASIPFAGFYALGVLYTLYIYTGPFRISMGSPWWILYFILALCALAFMTLLGFKLLLADLPSESRFTPEESTRCE